MEAANEKSGPLGLPSVMLSLLDVTSPLGAAQSGPNSIEDRSFYSRLGAERWLRESSTVCRRRETGLKRGKSACFSHSDS